MPSPSKENPIQKITLSNGIKIVAEEIPEHLSCALSIWINVGSIDENENNNGTSHFIEHIVFKGTKTRSALEVAEQSEDVGANLNAFTDREHTCYHTRVLSEYALITHELFLDMLFNPKLDEKDFELEKQVILEEIKMYKDTPEDLVQEMLYQTIWQKQTMGQPITGTTESITKLKRSSVEKFLKEFYTPDNMVISIAGKFNLEEIVEKTEHLTSHITTKTKKKELPSLLITPSISVEDREIEQAHLSFATKGTSVYEEDRYTLAVIDIALGGGMSSRLFQEIREKRGLAYAISSYYHTNKLGGLFGIYAGTAPKDTNQVMDLILKELKDIKINGLKPAELERAKMQLRTSLFLELESSKVRAFRNALYDLYYDRFITHEEVNKSIQSITNERVIKLATDILDEKYFALTVVGPKDKMPKSFSLTL